VNKPWTNFRKFNTVFGYSQKIPSKKCPFLCFVSFGQAKEMKNQVLTPKYGTTFLKQNHQYYD
jgi:hypothetical protein